MPQISPPQLRCCGTKCRSDINRPSPNRRKIDPKQLLALLGLSAGTWRVFWRPSATLKGFDTSARRPPGRGHHAYFAVPACRRTNCMVSLIAPTTPLAPPRMQIKFRDGQVANVCVGKTAKLQSLG